jgi:hypothetical protein
MVGLIPLFAVETLEPENCGSFAGFKRRMQWFIDNHADAGTHRNDAAFGARCAQAALS